MILVDTSAWVEYDRATESPVDQLLTDLVSQKSPTRIAVTEPVLMEVLAGVRSQRREAELRRLLRSFEWIKAEPEVDFEGASRIYRRCRASGVTPRGLIDCMIANIAIRTGSSVLAADRDFADIARIVPLTLESVDR